MANAAVKSYGNPSLRLSQRDLRHKTGSEQDVRRVGNEETCRPLVTILFRDEAKAIIRTRPWEKQQQQQQ